MSATVVPLGGDFHHPAQALLPWYANGRLDRAEANVVELHLAGCAQCQAELAWERMMLAVQAAPDSGAEDVERAWARMRERIGAPGPAAMVPPAARPRGPWSGGPRWLWWALGGQLAAILSLCAIVVAPRLVAEPYRALGGPGHAAAGNVVVRFRPDATEREIRRVLAAAGARLVDGPTVSEAYLLSVPADRLGAAVAGLRAQPAVVLAESLDAGGRP